MGCGLDRFQGSPAPLGLAARFRIIAQDGDPAWQEENYLMSGIDESLPFPIQEGAVGRRLFSY
jgi:hypothetical protein